MPSRSEINPVHAVLPATAEDALRYLRDHRGMSCQHMDALLVYVENLTGALRAEVESVKRLASVLSDMGVAIDMEPQIEAHEALIAKAEGRF